ncbi:hypothetical protein KC356_g6040 [Hortaea werneckii]|nr:hypothetical protein KC356_g6040 [Hortaea werneckii]
MRRQTPIAHLLYNHLFPRPTPTDPPSFAAHLARNLVPEVRIEVSTFYGDLNSVEARYPGLNYCYPPHRMRLGRFKHHRRLFDAFDSLGLTYNEIQDFCCWEGTKWARERYEKDEGISVLDTTGDDIAPFIDRRDRRVEDAQRRKISRHTRIEVLVEEARDGPLLSSYNIINSNGSSLHPRPPPHHHYHSPAPDAEMSDLDSLASDNNSSSSSDGDDDDDDDDDDASSDTTLPSHHRPHDILPPVAIPSHILSAWEQGHQLPPELEQFLKDHAGGGGGGEHAAEAAEGRSLPAGFDLRPLLSPSAAAAASVAAAEAAGRAGRAGRAATTTTGRAAAA